jgi:glycosyltransferase involved in cell wall biosynthesis
MLWKAARNGRRRNMTAQPKKKVMWVSDYPLRGSSFGQVTLDLLQRMPDTYEFTALGMGYRGLALKIKDNFRIFELEKSYQLRYYLQKIKPDVLVVFHSFYLLSQIADEIPLTNAKKILYIPCEGEDIPFQYRKYFTNFDVIATPSGWSQKIMHKAGIEAKVVPHAVDTTFFVPKSKQWHEFRFGYLGMNDIRKQIPRVMEAYSRLKEGILVIAAEQEGAYDLANLAKQYGIAPVFIDAKLQGLTLNREAIRDFLQSLDVYISPGSESFGIPALEAQACGVPAIACSHGASKEVLGTGALYCGIADYLESSVGKVGLVSTADLYRQMRFMLQVKSVWEKTQKNALLNAKKWTWDRAVQKMIEVIEK